MYTRKFGSGCLGACNSFVIQYKLEFLSELINIYI